MNKLTLNILNDSSSLPAVLSILKHTKVVVIDNDIDKNKFPIGYNGLNRNACQREITKFYNNLSSFLNIRINTEGSTKIFQKSIYGLEHVISYFDNLTTKNVLFLLYSPSDFGTGEAKFTNEFIEQTKKYCNDECKINQFELLSDNKIEELKNNTQRNIYIADIQRINASFYNKKPMNFKGANDGLGKEKIIDEALPQKYTSKNIEVIKLGATDVIKAGEDIISRLRIQNNDESHRLKNLIEDFIQELRKFLEFLENTNSETDTIKKETTKIVETISGFIGGVKEVCENVDQLSETPSGTFIMITGATALLSTIVNPIAALPVATGVLATPNVIKNIANARKPPTDFD